MPVESYVEHEIGAERSARDADREIAALASRQHGVVSRAQLAKFGLGRGAIRHRLDCGRLHPLHRGVYAVGHRTLSREGRWMAAVLAAGPGAVLSHRSAAALWGMRPSSRRRIEVTAAEARRPRAGIQHHRASLPADEVTSRLGIPVTTVSRTLLDLAAVVGRSDFERALHEAEVRRLTDPVPLADLLARYPRRRGAAVVRSALERLLDGATVTRSELEERFLSFLDAHRFERPELNAMVDVGGRGIEVDCLWQPRRLVVELDGHSVHGTSVAFERDRARDRALHAAGWRVVRITWRQLHHEPRQVEADLRRLLRAP